MPKAEFLEMCEAVKNQQASFYQIRHGGGVCRFVGVARGDDYLMWALTGRDLHKVAPEMIRKVKAAGFKTIQSHNYKKSIARLLGRIGFEKVESISHGDTVENIMSLNLE